MGYSVWMLVSSASRKSGQGLAALLLIPGPHTLLCGHHDISQGGNCRSTKHLAWLSYLVSLSKQGCPLTSVLIHVTTTERSGDREERLDPGTFLR